MLLIVAAVLFALGALGGLVMAIKSISGQEIPVALATLHGLLGASGLVLLILAVIQGVGGLLPEAALIVLLVAALGGFYLLSFHVRKERHPKVAIGIHATLAVIGFLILLTALLQGAG